MALRAIFFFIGGKEKGIRKRAPAQKKQESLLLEVNSSRTSFQCSGNFQNQEST